MKCETVVTGENTPTAMFGLDSENCPYDVLMDDEGDIWVKDSDNPNFWVYFSSLNGFPSIWSASCGDTKNIFKSSTFYPIDLKIDLSYSFHKEMD